jgi:hypothetical protein
MKYLNATALLNALTAFFGESLQYYKCTGRNFFMYNSSTGIPSYQRQQGLNNELVGQMGGIKADYTFDEQTKTVIAYTESVVEGKKYRTYAYLCKKADGIYSFDTYSEFLKDKYLSNMESIRSASVFTQVLREANKAAVSDAEAAAVMASARWQVEERIPQVLPADVVGGVVREGNSVRAVLKIRNEDAPIKKIRWWFVPTSAIVGQPLNQLPGTGDYVSGINPVKYDNDFTNRNRDTVIIPNKSFTAKAQIVYDNGNREDFVMASITISQADSENFFGL